MAAPDPSGAPDELPTATPEEVQEFAARGAAIRWGITPAAARVRLAAQDRFGRVVDQIRRLHPDDLSAAYWDARRSRGVIDIVAGAAAASAGDIMRMVGTEATIMQRGVTSEKARGDQAALLSERIRKAYPEIRTLSVHGSRDGLSFEVISPIPIAADVVAPTRRSAAVTTLPIRVAVEPSMRSALTGGVVGGAELNSPRGEGCTSGFTVKNPNGLIYLLTAGHCNDAERYGDNPWLVNAEWERRGQYGDLQAHRVVSPGVGLPKFQFTPGRLTTNKYLSGPVAGQTLNRYGRMTMETIEVDDPDSTETIAGTTLTHVAVTVSGTNERGGDSGGPWWKGVSGGASAVGLHIGWISTLGWRRAVFTPARNLYNVRSGWIYYIG